MNNQIAVIEYWRRTLDGREYCSNRLIHSEAFARRILLDLGYREIDDGIWAKDDMKALLTLRTIE